MDIAPGTFTLGKILMWIGAYVTLRWFYRVLTGKDSK